MFYLFYLQVEPVFLPACLNKAIQITSCVFNIGNNVSKLSMAKLIQLLNTDNISEMQKLAIFIKNVFNIYKDAIFN